jgi:integrase
VRRALQSFRAFHGDALETADADAFRRWLEHLLLVEGLIPNTVRKYGNCVRPWYRWAWRDARIVDAETAARVREVPNPKGAVAQGLPRPYKRKELDAFWAEFDARWPTDLARLMPRFVKGQSKYPRISDYVMHLQIEAIVHLALHCGLRRNEIFTAGLDDIHPDNAYVVVRNGKGGKYREVPMTADTRRALAVWFEARGQVMRALRVKHDSPWLGLSPRASKRQTYPSNPANPMSDRRFQHLISTIGAWELHRFRHTCGTEWLRAGMAVEKVQVLLGHSRIQQTMGYVQVLAQDVQADARKHEDVFADAVRRPVAA